MIDNKSDMYPLFRHSDVLITDYSSIFFDYLLLDRPIIHFAADLDSYRFRDRGFSYRFEDVRCGPVCSNLSSLMGQLARLEEGDKEYAQTRARVRITCMSFKIWIRSSICGLCGQQFCLKGT